jgi:NADPH-dependent 2,4-dienoyl-CoA reductase/sulfur reductase-like enzyme/rhodanese-related sulfurtransferase
MKLPKRILIVGGVAGGAACAARLRRLDESAEIVVFDRGPYVSFANCGLPYFVGGVIEDEKSLLVADETLFRERFNVTVHPRTEVLSIDRENQMIDVRELSTGSTRSERYDALVLSPGASPIRPPLPGVDLPGIFTLRSIPDSREIRAWIESRAARKAVVVGGGFIGLEMAENLARRGIQVTIVEMLDQVMPPLDPEIAAIVAEHLRHQSIDLALGDGVAGFEASTAGGVTVKTQGGREHEADMVILAIGVRPETALAKAAALDLGARGGIRVDDQMRTSDPHIWAVGDAVEVRDWTTGQEALIPLAGPAARQGRVAADVICGRPSRFRGVQGTAICGVFDLQVAATGASEKALKRAGIGDFEKIYLHPTQHAGYYPGAKRMHLKLLFRKSDGRILGAQGVGEDGVDRRIDVIAMAIQKEGTVYDLEEAELCYAPQFGGAKDAVNFAGMIASNVLRGDLPIVHWGEAATPATVFLDVRDADEYSQGHVHGAINVPVGELRGRLDELPPGNDLRVYCAIGQRGYVATRLLLQRGIAVRNLSGGLISARYSGSREGVLTQSV